jgi:hypothetical protein
MAMRFGCRRFDVLKLLCGPLFFEMRETDQRAAHNAREYD